MASLPWDSTYLLQANPSPHPNLSPTSNVSTPIPRCAVHIEHPVHVTFILTLASFGQGPASRTLMASITSEDMSDEASWP